MAPTQAPSPAVVVTRTPTPSTTTSPDFTDPSFDPVDYLNDVLPPLALSTQLQPPVSRGPAGAVNLTELNSRVQSILSQTNAQNIRHSTTLTQLTDDILRSGSRLAYEVEVLRGETISLSDTLTEGLRDDIARFAVSDRRTEKNGGKNNGKTEEEEEQHKQQEQQKEKDDEDEDDNNDEGQEGDDMQLHDPEYIMKLRTLNQVRAHLEDVVRTFGDAMEWPLPPSETSLTSSFLSVSAPESGPDSHSREEKGQEVAKKLRSEIATLLECDGDGVNASLKAAAQRVEELRTLATVWKGTAEEKARTRFVDGLMKMVDDHRRMLEAQGRSDLSQQAPYGKGLGGGHRRQESEGPGGGIFKNLHRLREEIYLE